MRDGMALLDEGVPRGDGVRVIKKGQLRRWRTINKEHVFLIVESSRSANSFCKVLDEGKLEWRSHLDVEANSEVIDETG